MIYWLQITSGRGPEECCWVVSQLVQYIISEALKLDSRAELIEAKPGTFPKTLTSAVIAMEGNNNLQEYISHWQGTVQWVGTSMYRPTNKRKNWFVSVKVLEPITQEDLKTGDIRVDRMRSSGPGGQHANKTETAIRITHIPTGLSAVSQQERSQHLNKKLALARLNELLQHKEIQTRSDFDQTRWQGHNSVERGNAIYVFEDKNFKLIK